MRCPHRGVRYGSIGGNAGFRFECNITFNFHSILLLKNKNRRENVRQRPGPGGTSQDEIVEDAPKLPK